MVVFIVDVSRLLVGSFFFQAEDGIRDADVTGVQTCALPIWRGFRPWQREVMMPYEFLLDTYETERIKTLSVWSQFGDADMELRPAPLARTPHEQMVHQCVSEHLWMTNMLGIAIDLPPLPASETRLDFLRH